MKYNIHVTLMSDLARMVKKILGKTVSIPTCIQYALERTMTMPGSAHMLEVVTLLDEIEYEQAGNHMLFVGSLDLQKMLMNAKFKMEGRKFRFPYDGFIINTPSAGDVAPFMVSHMTIPLRKKALKGLMEKAGQGDAAAELDPGSGEEGVTITMCYRKKYVRASIPFSKLSAAASADTTEEFHNVLGTYPGLCQGLDDEDRTELIKALHLLCGVSAYLEARPDSLKPGMPGEVAPRDIPDRATVKGVRSFETIHEPAGMRKRDGSATHYRTWFFRVYPLRKDGSRTDGLVFVHDTIVNEDMVPETITEV